MIAVRINEAILLLAGFVAAVDVGLPADAREPVKARASTPPQVTHTGPECFAGATAQQVSSRAGD